MTETVEVPAVRVGQPEDLEGMMLLAEAATRENAFMNPDWAKMKDTLMRALAQYSGVVGIIGEPGKPFQGAILLHFGELWYTKELTLEERAIFVDPEYRSAKGGRARRLCEFAKWVADSLEIPLTIGVLSNSRTEAKVRLYERMFGKPAGVYFLYGATTGLLEQVDE